MRPAEHPLDTCTCGDYRKDHDPDGTCRLCRSFNPSFMKKCTQFVIALPASPVDIERYKRLGISL